MHQQYPKALYHATLPAALVHNPVEHEALGEGWYESPADVPAAAEPTADADTADTADADPPASSAPNEFDTIAAEIVALTAKDAIDLIAGLEQPDALAAVASAERAGPNRKTVLAALEARVEAIS